MGLFDKLFGSKKSNSGNKDVKISKQETKIVNESFVSSCFNFDLEDQPDDRVWSKYEELRIIPQECEVGSIDKAQRMIKSAKSKYQDLDFVYYWDGFIGKKKGISGEPNRSYNEGLIKCKRKASLCSWLGDEAFGAGNLEDAIRWWIRSYVLQHKVGRYYDSSSFLYLAYFADACGMGKCRDALLAKHDSQRGGKVRLTSAISQKITYMSQKMATEDMKNTIQLLCKEYIE